MLSGIRLTVTGMAVLFLWLVLISAVIVSGDVLAAGGVGIVLHKIVFLPDTVLWSA